MTLLDIYVAAQHWRSMVGSPDSFEGGRSWMALLVAERPEMSQMIDERVSAGRWVGPRPDALPHVVETLARAVQTNDPKYVARAALALYCFAKRTGAIAQRLLGEAQFIKTCRDHPTVLAGLQIAGVVSMVPELVDKF